MGELAGPWLPQVHFLDEETCWRSQSSRPGSVLSHDGNSPSFCGTTSPLWFSILPSLGRGAEGMQGSKSPSPSQSLFLRLLESTHPVPLAMVQKLERHGRCMDDAPLLGPGQAVPGGLLMALHRALQVFRLSPLPSLQSGVGRHASPAKPFSSLGGPRGLPWDQNPQPFFLLGPVTQPLSCVPRRRDTSTW